MESRRPSYLALSDFPRVFPTSLGYRVVTWLHTYGANWLTSLGDEIDRDGSMINFAARRHANGQQKKQNDARVCRYILTQTGKPKKILHFKFHSPPPPPPPGGAETQQPEGRVEGQSKS
ncbi:hypothetical protein CISG_08695 [Coccidioides immitis RMSCC 3703]|uniref:Uncharacterized protein n=1 Tax=Coccidioides immitis RMSCC 3703 TaxID=454286 RepID=A0A0J8U2B7_COCIT|nr:hypothetical protein CISG_08695 [Coccidioides immitis RMSCC 3703]